MFVAQVNAIVNIRRMWLGLTKTAILLLEYRQAPSFYGTPVDLVDEMKSRKYSLALVNDPMDFAVPNYRFCAVIHVD